VTAAVKFKDLTKRAATREGYHIACRLICRPALNLCTGRVTNLYLCCQSAAGVTLSPVAFKAVSGFILLASTFDGRYSTSKLPSLEDWGRCGAQPTRYVFLLV
jgi:hypothetical protein